MTQDMPPDVNSQARLLFSDLIEGRWEQAHREIDANLRGHVNLDRFARAWTDAVGSAGSFERMGAPTSRPDGDYIVVDVPLAFRTYQAIAEAVFDRDGKVAGLALQYPRRHRLDPRTVRTLALRNPEIAGLTHARLF